MIKGEKKFNNKAKARYYLANLLHLTPQRFEVVSTNVKFQIYVTDDRCSGTDETQTKSEIT
jgi:hypothetical protein